MASWLTWLDDRNKGVMTKTVTINVTIFGVVTWRAEVSETNWSAWQNLMLGVLRFDCFVETLHQLV